MKLGHECIYIRLQFRSFSCGTWFTFVSHISLPNIQPLVISWFRYIYCGTVAIRESDLFDVLDLAHRYRVRGLEALIMEHLASGIDASNVARLVLHGQNYIDSALPK